MDDDSSPAPNPGAAVTVVNATKRFAGRCVLQQVSLTVAAGECFALLGPSGSGKSTLLRLISGIERVDDGRLWIGADEVTDVPPHRREVHTVFQHYALFPHLNVRANVAFPLRMAGVPSALQGSRVSEVLTWIGLERLADRSVTKLSGGERQRVALARALVTRPRCLLLDEPLAALDPHLRESTAELLDRVRSDFHLAYVYVTHDRQEALRVADRIGLLFDGRLEQVGSPATLYHKPATAFAASFIGPINWLSATVAHGDAIQLASGHIVEGTAGGRSAGSRLRVGVRPEDVALRGSGGLPATVVGSEFLGNGIRLKAKVSDGTVVSVELPKGQTLPAVGAAVFLGWNAPSVHVFDE